ncbi:ankyrin repeat domain-containing protein [Dactylonectria estremocensis]|uniref:Ankyrin repeat domain-containing protein n=1 Tax=Dactylonectria estremocensis TaxID=1079267 RepID=A0A9P9IZV0_9HYPO|nr:ankyrin repeat domain-containing protein [Dactylonectria estremocensis]
MSAVHQNNRLVKALLDSGVDFNERGAYGTVLQATIYTGNQETMAMLLEKGADVNAHVGYQATPLQLAANFGRSEMVSTLLIKGADINARQGITGTALQEASHLGNWAMVKTLLANGVDINVRSLRGTALQAAAAGRSHGIFLMLLSKGALRTKGNRFGNFSRKSVEGILGS